MQVIEINNNFDREVINYPKRVLIDFNAIWCGPCRMLKPIIEEVSLERNDIKIVSVDIDNNEDLAVKYNVYSIPTLVLMENGKEIKRHTGFMSKDEVNRFIGE